MPKFAANLSMLWPELDIYDRFKAAAQAGFTRVEILFVHAHLVVVDDGVVLVDTGLPRRSGRIEQALRERAGA